MFPASENALFNDTEKAVCEVKMNAFENHMHFIMPNKIFWFKLPKAEWFSLKVISEWFSRLVNHELIFLSPLILKATFCKCQACANTKCLIFFFYFPKFLPPKWGKKNSKLFWSTIYGFWVTAARKLVLDRIKNEKIN